MDDDARSAGPRATFLPTQQGWGTVADARARKSILDDRQSAAGATVGMDATIPAGRVVVVIDVIRAFTTAAVAFERGVTEIACVPSTEAARDLRRRHPGSLLAGEVNGLRPAGFDFGNSPYELYELSSARPGSAAGA